MITENKSKKNTHHGHAVKRLRHTLGVKQEALAFDLNMSQQSISVYEQKQVIEDEMLEKIAKALNVSPQLIRELEEDPLTVIIENNTFGDNNSVGYDCNRENFDNIYNPIERIIELANEKTALYERMLELEKEKIAMLEQLLRDKNSI